MWDRLRGSLSLILAVLALLGTAAQLVAWTSGKAGIVITGAVERNKFVDSLIAARTASADSIHQSFARVDSILIASQALDAVKIDAMLAMICANSNRRDRELSRLQALCTPSLDRWHLPGDRR